MKELFGGEKEKMKKENDGKYVNDLLLLYLIFFISILEM